MRRVGEPAHFAAWRQQARQLLAEEVPPEIVLWESDQELAFDFGETQPASTIASQTKHNVSKAFLDWAESIACHRDREKWELLYRVLWRLTHGEPHLLRIGLHPDVVRGNRMKKAIGRDCHKMKAFVRFREVEEEAPSGEPYYVAWFEPQHLIVERMAGFFRKRFANMHWSILTPDACLHWDQRKLYRTPGVTREMAPQDDDYEALWLTYYKNIFNPARLKEKAMCAEMPKKYWHNLPEAVLIPELIEKGRRMDLQRDWD